MAIVYCYFIGYIKDDKIYPLGMYNNNGKMVPVIEDSHSFASDLYELFDYVGDNQFSEELEKEFSYSVYGTDRNREHLRYLKVKDLPTESYIKTGYFLISDIERFENDTYDDISDIFYEHLSPVAYHAKFNSELVFGKPEPKVDCEGEEFPVYSAGEYAYYAYPDRRSREYDAELLRTVASQFKSYRDEDKGRELVILEVER